MADTLSGQRVIRFHASQEDIKELQTQLEGSEFRLMPLGGDLFHLEVTALRGSSSRCAAEWTSWKLIRLLSAAVHLRFGAADWIPCPDARPAPICSQAPTVLEILRVASEHEGISKALHSFRSGGPEGLFEAYDALMYELMHCGVCDYTRDIGTKEWMIQRRWAVEAEIDRFLDTVQCFRREANPPREGMIFPQEAEALVRRLLWKFVLYCSHSEIPVMEADRSEIEETLLKA